MSRHMSESELDDIKFFFSRMEPSGPVREKANRLIEIVEWYRKREEQKYDKMKEIINCYRAKEVEMAKEIIGIVKSLTTTDGEEQFVVNFVGKLKERYSLKRIDD